ncbi:hypothetical protein AHAS_Ahas15G0238100 [Arachis hypogaea]
MCCNGGKVSLPQINAPEELLEIFLDSSVEGNHFRKHIRGYNHVFSFTSCGVHIDEQLATVSHGIYTFRAQGSIYHMVWPLQIQYHKSALSFITRHYSHYYPENWHYSSALQSLLSNLRY